MFEMSRFLDTHFDFDWEGYIEFARDLRRSSMKAPAETFAEQFDGMLKEARSLKVKLEYFRKMDEDERREAER
jgi:hypothetical protein